MTTLESSVTDHFVISNLKQLHAISSPARQVILDALTAGGRATTIKEIAHRVSRSPESLYYHFRALEKVGLVFDAGSKLEHGKPVRLYCPVAWQISIHYDLQSSGFKKIISAIFVAASRLASRDFRKGIELDNARSSTPERNLYMGRGEAWLSPQQICEINQHVTKISEILNAGQEADQGERCAVFFAMSPLSGRD